MTYGARPYGSRGYGDSTGSAVTAVAGAVVTYTISAVSPANGTVTTAPSPNTTVLPTSSDASVMQVQWEWDTINTFTNATGNKRTLTQTAVASGVNKTASPSSNLTAGRTWYWRARAGDGSAQWSTWTAANSIIVELQSAAVAYVYENVGFSVQNKQEGYGYLFENVGFLVVSKKEGHGYLYENMGFAIVNKQEGYCYVYEGDINTTTPTPHIWYLYRDSGRSGDGFTIVGYGFGDNQAAFGGIPYYISETLAVTSWSLVSGNAHALDASRSIDPILNVATPDHQEIAVVVPTDALPPGGLVTVTTNGP